ncbi:tight junction associated protein 1 (predicted), isoform CRA_c [Rattus norvegicus]|uniref:Tight junction associated protein 1 (Predicted), isoform CRA_c n=1 Tax=Rattus norvegicus TaxID=10116 RepID=A6JIS3_RAT|nr:tight junction associated protein 1 (predicted), isoform CRA_c [Rattus norvegicus]
MTSAAPAKKPYRKAPPEHRELRLETPVSRLEQQVSRAGVWPWLTEAGAEAGP